jgi:hypothetical protein
VAHAAVQQQERARGGGLAGSAVVDDVQRDIVDGDAQRATGRRRRNGDGLVVRRAQ